MTPFDCQKGWGVYLLGIEAAYLLSACWKMNISVSCLTPSLSQLYFANTSTKADNKQDYNRYSNWVLPQVDIFKLPIGFAQVGIQYNF